MSKRAAWKSMPRPDAGRVRDVVEDEARITAFRELVYQLRVDADLTQAELARRMGTTQSAIARMESGGTRPTLETLERVAGAVGKELAVVVGTRLIEKRLTPEWSAAATQWSARQFERIQGAGGAPSPSD